jgi:hypothetical protein
LAVVIVHGTGKVTRIYNIDSGAATNGIAIKCELRIFTFQGLETKHHKLPEERRCLDDMLLVASSNNPVSTEGFRVGAPHSFHWREVLESLRPRVVVEGSAAWVEQRHNRFLSAVGGTSFLERANRWECSSWRKKVRGDG